MTADPEGEELCVELGGAERSLTDTAAANEPVRSDLSSFMSAERDAQLS